MSSRIYSDGEYGCRHPDWHVEDSPWKAEQVTRMLRKHHLEPSTICEVGCGAGEVLYQLLQSLSERTRFCGYEISPQAFAKCEEREAPRLRFFRADLLSLDTELFDLLLCLDVVEHVEDYLGFLRGLRDKARHAIFHLPLDLSVQSVLRVDPILRARRQVGHLHYFMRDTALESLRYAGYEIEDWFYTRSGIERSRSLKSRLAAVPRRLLTLLTADFGVRLLGGHSLLVLARPGIPPSDSLVEAEVDALPVLR